MGMVKPPEIWTVSYFIMPKINIVFNCKPSYATLTISIFGVWACAAHPHIPNLSPSV